MSRKPPKDLDLDLNLDMTSQVSIAIHSLIGFVFTGEDGGYRIPINTMKEMQREAGFWFYSRQKALSFHTLDSFTLLSLFWFLWFFQTYLKPLATPQNCVCTLTDKQWTCALPSIEIVQLATWLCPKVVWWLRSEQLHSHLKHLPCGSHGHLGRL